MIMNQNKLISEIVDELRRQYNCHTVILYGSRARGDYTNKSDIDIAGFRKNENTIRVANYRSDFDVYLDMFVYLDSDLDTINDGHLCMHDGIVLYEEQSFGTQLLQKIKSIVNSSPSISENEIQMRKIWYRKMLDRASVSDIEGKYRQIWALFTLLEDYFVFRGIRYLGPKKAFQYLQIHDIAVYDDFNNALSNPKDLKLLSELVSKVIN